MQLNLPILDQVAGSNRILIVGAGGGFDIFAGLPLYFTLRQMGKTVHLANYTHCEIDLIKLFCAMETLLPGQLVGVRSPVRSIVPYFPEGYLSQWFQDVRGEAVPVWMLARTGARPLMEGYGKLADHLGIDALILVDGGVDSLMRGDEAGAGTLVEDSISLTAAASLVDIPVKILACLGFGTEVEEAVCHHHVLENMAALIKAGGFYGSCSLLPRMEAFQQFESACRYVWEKPKHAKSHITTRVIPAVHGEFGNYHMYEDDDLSGIGRTRVLISPLMSVYWFFDAHTVIERNLLIDDLLLTETTQEALAAAMRVSRRIPKQRPRQSLPY